MSSSSTTIAVTDWTENPVYRAACSRTRGRGGRFSYMDSRKANFDRLDHTYFVAGQATWADTDLPDILKIENPPPGWKDYATNHVPQTQMTMWGTQRTERWHEAGTAARVIKEIEVLPKQIFTGEPGWVLEAWMRLDPTITFEDILMRMQIDARPTLHELEMRRARARNDLNLTFWEATPSHQHDHRYRIMLSQLPRDQISRNVRAIGTAGAIATSLPPGSPEASSSPEVPHRVSI